MQCFVSSNRDGNDSSRRCNSKECLTLRQRRRTHRTMTASNEVDVFADVDDDFFLFFLFSFRSTHENSRQFIPCNCHMTHDVHVIYINFHLRHIAKCELKFVFVAFLHFIFVDLVIYQIEMRFHC